MNNQFSAQSLQGALQLTSYLDLQNQKQYLQNQGGTPAIQGGMPAFQGIPVFQGGTYGMISGSGLHAFIPSGLTTIGMGSISKNQDKKLLQEISKLELELEEKKEERERFYEKMESQKRKYIYLIDELEAEKEKLENDIYMQLISTQFQIQFIFLIYIHIKLLSCFSCIQNLNQLKVNLKKLLATIITSLMLQKHSLKIFLVQVHINFLEFNRLPSYSMFIFNQQLISQLN